MVTARYLIERLGMVDRCELGRATVDTTDYVPAKAYEWSETIKCAVVPADTSETADGAEMPTGHAAILIPVDTPDVQATARVRVTRRKGRTLTHPALYDVIGIDEGEAAIVLRGRRVGE